MKQPSKNDSETLSLASEAYEAIGNTPKSVSLLRQAIVLSPTEASYYNTFAAICLDHDSFQVGIDMINAGLQRIPDDSSLYISRGLLYAQLANYEQAEADFNTAERLDPKQSISTYAMDMIDLQKNLNLSDKDHPEASLAEIRSQLKVHPDSPYLNFLLATLLVNQGGETQEDGVESKPFDEAMNAALRAVKLKPEMVKARDILATMYINSGHYDLAAEQCKIALQYAPTDKTALYHLIVALRHSGQNEKHEEIQVLVKRLSELQQTSLRQETERKRFKLEEGPAFSK
jgi:tetratricopeptide (TPR) repeat protein